MVVKMTTREYLKSTNEEEKKQFNRELCEKYPWLIPTNKWSGIKITEAQNGGFWPGSPESIPEYDYEYTELDSMPKGWRLAFGDQMIEEIDQELRKYDYVNKYQIIQIKEKYGSLRWYDNGSPRGKLSDTYEIVEVKYGEPSPWNPEKVLIYDHSEHYLPLINLDGDLNLSEEELAYRKEYNKNSVQIYHVYDLLEKCQMPDIIRKYELLSEETCIDCGKPAKYITTGWISPYCEDCVKHTYDSYLSIEEYYKGGN